jgi:predicted CoA-binding protein
LSRNPLLVESSARAIEIIVAAKRVAILGIKPEEDAHKPAFYVSAYLQSVGIQVVPVPVYYPDKRVILGETVYRKLAEVPGELDLVVVFRRPRDIPPHVDDIITKKPRAVWFQLGIRNEEAARRLAEAGIEVVQDRCTMVDHRMAADI